MNKKLFLKLLLSLSLSLSLISCSQKTNSSIKDNSSIESTVKNKKQTDNLEQDTQENISQNTQDNLEQDTQENISQNTQDNLEQDTQENISQDTKTEYYILIKDAYKKQQNYINSIDDSKVKQSLQTADSAAILKANELLMEYPEDTDLINTSLKKVLASE